jgi:Helix-turn-helix of DDE superfamily endonuclease
VLRCRCRAQTLVYVAGVIRRHRRQIGSCWCKCDPGRQALLVLAHLRKGETFAELAAGFGISTATAWRYVRETVALLAARAPKLPGALRAAKRQKDANRVHARLRATGERANAQLKSWRILRKLRCCPWRAGQLTKAIHVLQTRETTG